MLILMPSFEVSLVWQPQIRTLHCLVMYKGLVIYSDSDTLTIDNCSVALLSGIAIAYYQHSKKTS